MIDLSGKKILFIGPKYYDYHTNIIQKLQHWGGEVDYYPEMINNFLQRAAKVIKGRFRTFVQDRYLHTLLDSIGTKHYDHVLLIRGEIITPSFMEELRRRLPKAHFTLYQWDSQKHNNYLPILPYFDHALTFDPLDAQNFHLDYLPLFYTDAYKQIAESTHSKEYDIAFFGAYHSDRLAIVKQIDAEAKRYGFKFYHHIYITKFSLFRALLRRKITLDDLHYLKTFTVHSSVIHDIYAKTKAVLDVEMTHQNGLTIRTLEVLGSNLKLLTTNTTIQNEPFFDPHRIAVLNRSSIELSPDFFATPLAQDPRLDHYHIDHWLTTLLSRAAQS